MVTSGGVGADATLTNSTLFNPWTKATSGFGAGAGGGGEDSFSVGEIGELVSKSQVSSAPIHTTRSTNGKYARLLALKLVCVTCTMMNWCNTEDFGGIIIRISYG